MFGQCVVDKNSIVCLFPSASVINCQHLQHPSGRAPGLWVGASLSQSADSHAGAGAVCSHGACVSAHGPGAGSFPDTVSLGGLFSHHLS